MSGSSAVPSGVAGQMKMNGVADGQPVVKRRRGRRKNVEGMDLLFMNKNRVPAVPDQVCCFIFFVAVLGVFLQKNTAMSLEFRKQSTNVLLEIKIVCC